MNPIRCSLRLARKDLKILFKDRGQLAVLFVLPLLFALIMGGPYALLPAGEAPSREPRLSIKAYAVNGDQGPYGAQVVEVLRGVGTLRLYSSRTVDEADQKVAEGEAAAAIIIPADFSAQLDANQPIQVELIKDPTQQVEAQIVARILNEALTELGVRAEIEYGIRAVYEKTGVLEGADPELARAVQTQMMGVVWTAVQEIRQNPAIAVASEDLAGEEIIHSPGALMFAYVMPMFATMFAFFLVGFMAQSIMREKEVGSFRRLLAAPIHRGTVIAGKMLAFIGVVFLQMVVLFGICHALFEMPLGDSPLGLLTLTLVLALASTGLGMLVGSIARTSKQAEYIGLVLGFLLLFASDVINPTITLSTADVTGFGLRSEGLTYYIAQLTPHAHALDGYVALMLDGAGLVDILPNIVALLGFAVLFFLVAMWRFKFD